MSVQISGYRSTELIFESQRSLVYRGIREKDQRKIIIKTTKEKYPSVESVAQFRYEANLTKELNFSGVIHLYDLQQCGKSLAMILEDGGENLYDCLLEELSLNTFFEIAIQTCKILGRIHQHNVIHKDITPRNILWNLQTQEIKIIDFGISSKLSREHQDIMVSNTLEGSLPYLSPEQTGRMNRPLDYRTDFYSLGVTFYQLLTGKLPFEAEDMMGWLHCHIAQEPPDPQEINPELPSMVVYILLKLMAKNAEDRYQGCTGLIYDLEKCKEEWEGNREISLFSLGEKDICEKFQFPPKLYGREQEVSQLFETYHKIIEKKQMEVFLVSGYSGSGKSVLVHELQKAILQRKGYFIEGKFDQFQQAVPYHAFTQAFRDLIQQLLSESGKKLQVWKEKLLEALKPNAQLVIDLIPEVELIIGKQPPTQDLIPSDAQNRFIFTLRNFVKIFCQDGHPLIVFLDDLQWADLETLNMIEGLVCVKGLRNLFIICAYRDHEIDEKSTFAQVLKKIQKGTSTQEIVLLPWEKDTLVNVVQDTFHCNEEQAEPLADLVYQKTGGSPFFVRELLQNLYHEEYLNFSSKQGRWKWDLEKIQEVEISDNVVEFVIKYLKKLSPETQEVLKLGACVGNHFTLEILASLKKQPQTKIGKSLIEAVHQGILIPLSNQYRYLEAQAEHTEQEIFNFDISYQFQHDRLQQASYALLEEKKRGEIHLEVARFFLQNTPAVELEDKIIEIVGHYNEGKDLIQDISEKEELIRLNLLASKKAKFSAAYLTALECLKIARNFLPENSWQTRYQLYFDVNREYAECSYLCGEFQEAEDQSKELLQVAKTKFEKAKIYHTQSLQYSFLGKHTKAIEAGVRGLQLFGVSLQEKPGVFTVLKEITITKWHLRNQTPETLFHRPSVESKEIKMVMRLLSEMLTSAYLTGNENLILILSLKVVRNSFRYGKKPESAFGYTAYAILVGSVFNNLKEGYEYGKLSMRINQHFNDIEFRCRLLLAYTIAIHSWNHHWKTLPPLCEQAVTAGYQSGDLFYLAAACHNQLVWNPTLDLEEIIQLCKKLIPVIIRTKSQDLWDAALLTQHVWLNYRGKTDSHLSLDDATFQEKEWLERVTNNHFISGVAGYHSAKVRILYLYEEYSQAYVHLQKGEKNVKALIGVPTLVEFSLYSFLTLTALYPQASLTQKAIFWVKLKIILMRVRRWAKHCPENFFAIQSLLEAEYARISGKFQEAMRGYEQAVHHAHQNEYIEYESLSNEVAAKFYLQLGHKKIAILYMREAHYCYERWGAIGKTQFLEERYPNLLQFQDHKENLSVSTTLTTYHRVHNLDLIGVAKASQALSGEVVLEQLLTKLITILKENAGGQKSFLLLQDDHTKEWFIQAESLETQKIMVLHSHPLEKSEELPYGMIQYVIRSQETILLDDATKEGNFQKDPYVIKYSPKSILIMPILRQAKLIGILYLENQDLSHAFTTERIEVLKILSSQAAISIENALIYHNLEQKVEERTKELREAQKQLVHAAHQAGMSEIAVEVFHSIGNILTSVQISIEDIQQTLKKSEIDLLIKANSMLSENVEQLEHFLFQDPKGKKLLNLYQVLGDVMQKEQKKIFGNVNQLLKDTFMLRKVVKSQQEYASRANFTEDVNLVEVIEDALETEKSSLELNYVQLQREMPEVATIHTSRYKVQHILLHLIKNGIEALHKNAKENRVLLIKVEKTPSCKIVVIDNGHGILDENLVKVFAYGFTTKSEGYGFGLHSAANSMAEMGGSLTVSSEGEEQGTTFTMNFPKN